MSKKSFHIKAVTISIIALFILASCSQIIGGYSEKSYVVENDFTDIREVQNNAMVTCYTFGFPGEPKCEVSIPIKQAELLLEKIEDLQIEIAYNPGSLKAIQLQDDIIEFASEYYLLPEETSPEMINSQLNPNHVPQHNRRSFLPPLQNRESEWFCNFASTGSGSALPIIVLPRLIPILLIPIPRLFVHWSTMTGITSVGGLISRTGFIAYGQQKGTALGFWGIGFSVFLPPIMQYGLLGYALYATVTAEEFEYWPPNYPPTVTAISPPDGAENVPISTSELKFSLDDFNGDTMDYTVTTYPDIGSGSETDVSNGMYTVPISGLEGTELYTWEVEVSDGENLVTEAFTFTTESVAPIVYDPSPEDGERYVFINLSQLSFKLKDLQGDPMDYTVETSPDIGSGSGSGVEDGTYTVDVSGLNYLTEYTWYVNATDGTYWKHKVFNFRTGPIMVFDPFEEGWLYRKEVTIDHIKVDGDLVNFPVLLSIIDTDLRDKAQTDGDDILFMDETGVATRLYHEIEYYDDSNSELVAWVNLPTVSSDEDTVFYMYYGNTSSINQESVEVTWNSNYIIVQHLQEEGIGTRFDSTIYDHDGTPENYDGDEAQTGKIDGADDFDGGEWINVNSVADMTSTLNQGSVVAWVDPGANCVFMSQNDYDDAGDFFYLIIRDGRYISGAIGQGGVWEFTGTTDISNGWHMIVFQSTGGSNNFYVDGQLEMVTWSEGSSDGTWFNDCGEGQDTFTIGALNRGYGVVAPFNGIIDEVRVLNEPLNSDWISTAYNNQNDPSNFVSFGPEEPGP